METSAPRVLVVESDEQIRELLIDLLDEEGYATASAPALRGAFTLVDEQIFHLILADLFVGKSPHAFTEAHLLRRRAQLTPVALMTTQPILPEEAMRQGFAFLTPKPFDLEPLLEEIARTINQPLTAEQERQAEVVRQHFAAVTAGHYSALASLCTEDVTFYPPSNILSAAVRRVRGCDAMRAYLQEMMPHLPYFSISSMLISARPKGLAVRYSANWLPPEARMQRMTGVALYHFQGERIHQIGAGWNTRRLRALLESTQTEHVLADG